MFNQRRKILLGVIALLAVWMIIWKYIPVGNGNWNAKELEKIETSPKQNDFCFAVMGDNKNGFSTFHKIIKDLNTKDFLFTINIGDLVEDGNKEKYRIFYNEIQNLKNPFLVAIGNHDIREKGRANYFDIFGNFYYSFTHGDSIFIVLDNANEESIDQQQMDWLKTELAKNYKNKFVFLHVPPFDPRGYTEDIPKLIGKGVKPEHRMSDLENAKQFENIVAEYKVTTVFTSHIHGYFEETQNNIKYIITGGAGGEMLFSDPNHYFYHYINTCIKNGVVSHEVVKFPSPDNNIVDRLSYTAWLYTWYFVVTHKSAIVISLIVLFLIIDLAYQYRDKVLKELTSKVLKRMKPKK